MSQFSFADYQNVVAQAQNEGSSKVGYFKLKDDGDEALVRINCATVEDLLFASVHTLQAGGKWMKVSCLNPLGNYDSSCPLCSAVKNGDKRISKAGKKVYLEMLCAYKDKTTGQFSAAIPVIWERPAAFSRDIANKLKDYGDLRNVVLKITRNGAAGDMKTTYGMDFIPHYNTPELVSTDFSAFENFNIAKHSYWEKSVEDINTFLMTSDFPAAATANGANTANVATAPAQAPQAPVNPYAQMMAQAMPAQQPAIPIAQTPVYNAPATAPVVAPAQPAPSVAPAQPVVTPVQTPAQPAVVPGMTVPGTSTVAAPQPTAPTAQPGVVEGDRPVRNFTGFSF